MQGPPEEGGTASRKGNISQEWPATVTMGSACWRKWLLSLFWERPGPHAPPAFTAWGAFVPVLHGGNSATR